MSLKNYYSGQKDKIFINIQLAFYATPFGGKINVPFMTTVI